MKKLSIFFLFIFVSHVAGGLEHIGFGGERNFWFVTIRGDGSATISGMNANASWADAPPGSFNLSKIDARLGPLLESNPGLEYDVSAYSSLRTSLDTTKRYFPENLDYLKTLFREVLAKSTRFSDTPESLRAFLYDNPPMGLHDLELEDWQLKAYAKSTRQTFRWEKRRPKSMLPERSTVSRRFPMLGEVSSVAAIMFSTPWPYLALLCLLALGLRRHRLNKRPS